MAAVTSTFVLALGPAIAKALVKYWADGNIFEEAMGGGIVGWLTELTKDGVAGRKGARLVEDVADRLCPTNAPELLLVGQLAS